MKFSPHAYQAYCIQRAINEDKLGLYLDMGLGKTIITLTAIADLKYNRFQVRKVLIIAPKKVAEATWNREIDKWEHLQLLRISNVLGSERKRVKALNQPADIYIINRENVPWIVDYYRNDWPFDMVVIDEMSSFKSHAAKRFKALAMVRGHIKRLIGLTGTPAPNGLMDLWAQLYLLDQGERLEKKISHYREKYFEPDQRDRNTIFSYRPKAGAEEIIYGRISDICISMKADDYLTLPDITYDVVPVVLDERGAKAYKELERKMLIEVDPATIVSVASAAALSNKLLQLCNGAIYDENREVHEIHTCKLEAFAETVEQLSGQPVLVFYNFKHDIPRIMATLKKIKRPDGKPLVIRELNTKEEELAWNRREIDILLTHPASSAYGLNLQDGGNHIIWFGLNWSLELYLQANKRLHRQGQKQKVIVHILAVEGGRDEDVIQALNDKDEAQETLLASLKARIEQAKEPKGAST